MCATMAMRPNGTVTVALVTTETVPSPVSFSAATETEVPERPIAVQA